MTTTEPGSDPDVRAVKDALRALVDGERPGGDGAAAVAAATDALAAVGRAADAADDGAFDRVRAVERAAQRRGDAALAADCRRALDALDGYRRAAADHFGDGGDRTGTGPRDAGLISGDGLPPGDE